MSAEDLTRDLYGKWHGSYGTAQCPAHDDRNPSLSVKDGDDGMLLVHCHAGCSQDAVIAAMKERELWHSLGVEDELGVSEGIENGLSVQQTTGLPVWAALSTSGLSGLVMPSRVRRIVILADGDEPGEKAAQTAAARWCNEGRQVRIARPPRGSDFNDLLLSHAPSSREGAA